MIPRRHTTPPEPEPERNTQFQTDNRASRSEAVKGHAATAKTDREAEAKSQPPSCGGGK